jgi:hypothetical protein
MPRKAPHHGLRAVREIIVGGAVREIIVCGQFVKNRTSAAA